MADRALVIDDPTERANLLAFVTNALRLDEAAVIRLRSRADGRVTAWVATGFDVLAARTVGAVLTPADATVAGDALQTALAATSAGELDLGYPMDSSWRWAVPPERGFHHVDDVPAHDLVTLARRGSELAAEHGSGHGPPASLLDQEVVEVSGEGERVGVPMRMVFALVGMGFVPDYGGADTDLDLDGTRSAEMVRVRCQRNWIRLDARYGSVSKRRVVDPPLLLGT